MELLQRLLDQFSLSQATTLEKGVVALFCILGAVAFAWVCSLLYTLKKEEFTRRLSVSGIRVDSPEDTSPPLFLRYPVGTQITMTICGKAVDMLAYRHLYVDGIPHVHFVYLNLEGSVCDFSIGPEFLESVDRGAFRVVITRLPSSVKDAFPSGVALNEVRAHPRRGIGSADSPVDKK